MSAAVGKPRREKKSNKLQRATNSTATPEQRAKANDFSEQLLGGAPPAQQNKSIVVGRNDNISKKRNREEAAESVEREGSPSKRLKDSVAHEEASDGGVNNGPPYAVPLQASANKSKWNHSSTLPRRDFTEESTQRPQQSPQTVAGTSYTKTNLTSGSSGAVPGLPAELESPFVSVNASFKVTVPPVAQLYPLEGALAHYVSPLLLTWHPQLDGILLAYNNAQLQTQPPKGNKASTAGRPMAQAVDECAAPYIWLIFDALVFRPKKGLEMEGYLNLQNESHITLVLWNFFTVTISYKRLPKTWIWRDHYEENGNVNTDAEVDKPMRRPNEQWGAWYDGQGNEIDGLLRFRIKDWDCAPPGANGEGSFLSIQGSMLTAEEESNLEAEVAEEMRRRRELSATPKARTALQGVLKGGTLNQAATNAKSPASATKSTATGAKRGRPRKSAQP